MTWKISVSNIISVSRVRTPAPAWTLPVVWRPRSGTVTSNITGCTGSDRCPPPWSRPTPTRSSSDERPHQRKWETLKNSLCLLQQIRAIMPKQLQDQTPFRSIFYWRSYTREHTPPYSVLVIIVLHAHHIYVDLLLLYIHIFSTLRIQHKFILWHHTPYYTFLYYIQYCKTICELFPQITRVFSSILGEIITAQIRLLKIESNWSKDVQILNCSYWKSFQISE